MGSGSVTCCGEDKKIKEINEILGRAPVKEVIQYIREKNHQIDYNIPCKRVTQDTALHVLLKRPSLSLEVYELLLKQ